MSASAQRRYFSSPWRELILAIACLFAVLPGIFTLPPLDRDESRFVQATKQMLETGDYVDIRFQDEHRYKKPVGIYWLQTAAVKLTGQDANAAIWAYRLSSTVAAVIAVVMISGLAGYLFGATAAWGAGIMLIGLFGLGFEGRLAKTDATLLAITLIAQSALARLYIAPRRDAAPARGWWWAFWLAIGAGLLVKGPVTPAISALTILTLAIVDPERGWMKSLKPARGVALALLAVLPWFAAITWRSGLDFWTESVGKDFLGKIASGQESHGAPPGYYVLTYSLYMWPFGLMAITGGLKALNRFRDPRMLFLLGWYIPFWLLLEITPTKLPHYPLPSYPALLLAGAWAFLSEEGRAVELKRWQTWLIWLTAFGLAAVTLAFAAGAIAGGPAVMGLFFWVGIPAALAALAAGYLASGWGRPEIGLRRLAGASLASVIFISLFSGYLVPALKPLWLSPAINAAFEASKPCPESTLASVGYSEPSLVFLAGTATEFTDLPGAARHLARADGCGIAMIPESQWAEAEEMMPDGMRLESVAQISGINYSKGDKLNLVMLRQAK